MFHASKDKLFYHKHQSHVIIWQISHFEPSKNFGSIFCIKIHKGSMTPPVGDGGATILQSWVCVSPSKQHVEMGRAPKAATDASTLALATDKKRVGQVSLQVGS